MSIATPIKRVFKHGLQTFAAYYGPHTRQSNIPQLMIIMYHRILPTKDKRVSMEEPGMVVSPESFRANLQTLAEYFTFVKLSDWIDRRNKGLPLPDKACAVTFDDGWVDNYEYAFPVLQELDVPATIFVVANMIGTRSRFWPERLARTAAAIASRCPELWSTTDLQWLRSANTDYAFSSEPPSREQLSQLVAQAKHMADADIHRFLDKLEVKLKLNEHVSDASLMHWDQVKEMTASGIIEIGSHTCHHTRLIDNLNSEELEQEIIQSKYQIEQHINQPITTFCYPNGDFSEPALSLVRQHYSCAVTTSCGWNDSQTDPYLLQRIGVHEDTARNRTAFLARISGWL